MRTIRITALITASVVAALLVYVLGTRTAGVPPLGTLLDPVDGLYRTARLTAQAPSSTRLEISGLRAPVQIVRDDRGVPHIFAESDLDAITALGYVVAQDRLFQMDFVARVASGRLASALGPSAVSADRFLRSTGMDWGAHKNLDRIRQEKGIEWDLIQSYGAGVNAYLNTLAPEDLPFEFRLLGYAPDRYTPIQALRVLQYMTYDLTYRSDDATYAILRRRLGDAFDTLYPPDPAGLYTPIIPPGAQSEPLEQQPARVTGTAGTAGGEDRSGSTAPGTTEAGAWWTDALAALHDRAQTAEGWQGTPLEGYRHGKGSNNWAVASSRSTTGAPILAGDMHLSLTLPAIWYEAHLVTPTMNAYGLTVPGAPGLVEAFTDHIGWAYTNTGSDQIDHYALKLDTSGTRYFYEGRYRDIEAVLDTIQVNGAAPVLDTLYYSHFGPVHLNEADSALGAVAIQWVAHKPSRTLEALWRMVHADDLASFEEGLQSWGAPMQNILYADTGGTIAIRSTGYMPVRRAGHGRGLLDGTSDAFAWTGVVPFDELPYARNPAQGFLASANQKPTDGSYPHYLNHDWRDGYRSLRLDTLLSNKPQHSVADMKAYQADVRAMQRDVFVPFLAGLDSLSPRADTLRTLLRTWDGETTTDRPEPLVLDEFLAALHALMWDEGVFEEGPVPEDAPLVALMRNQPSAQWFDIVDTPARENASSLLRTALDATADSLEAKYGWDTDAWRWGDHHKVIFQHMTQAEPLKALWRGPVEYPGFASTLSPARDRRTTHSASQRIVVDFSQSPPKGVGIYPGGQSGNPLHPTLYDLHLPSYTNFEYYDLLKPATPDDLPDEKVLSRLDLVPAGS